MARYIEEEVWDIDEYIKREDALDAVLFALVGTGLQSTAINALRDIPTADVVEVVRCKDCIHARNMPLGLCYLHTEPYDNAKGYKGDAVCVEPNDFCSYGERREWKQLVAATEILKYIFSDLKKEIHDNAVYPHCHGVEPYISLKVFDAVINKLIGS